MLKIQTRKEILLLNPIFTDCLLANQEANYSFEDSDFYGGEEIAIDDDGGTEILTEAKAEAMNAENRAWYQANKDVSPFAQAPKLDYAGAKTFVASAPDTEGYLKTLAETLAEIMLALKQESLMVMAELNTPWLSQKNPYPQANDALNYFSRFMDEKFDGGLLLSPEDLTEFVPHFFWMVRCNASLPLFWLSFPKSKTLMTICRNGVLHLDFYDAAEKTEVLKIAKKKNLRFVKVCSDPIPFDEFEGRHLIVE